MNLFKILPITGLKRGFVDSARFPFPIRRATSSPFPESVPASPAFLKRARSAPLFSARGLSSGSSTPLGFSIKEDPEEEECQAIDEDCFDPRDADLKFKAPELSGLTDWEAPVRQFMAHIDTEIALQRDRLPYMTYVMRATKTGLSTKYYDDALNAKSIGSIRVQKYKPAHGVAREVYKLTIPYLASPLYFDLESIDDNRTLPSQLVSKLRELESACQDLIYLYPHPTKSLADRIKLRDKSKLVFNPSSSDDSEV